MNLDRTTLSRNITLLTKRGLLETLPSTGRRRLVQLTGQGQAVFAQAYESWQRARYPDFHDRRAKLHLSDD
jgi:DNA-binding MarR family transcriptional regulator